MGRDREPPLVLVTNFDLAHVLAGHEMDWPVEGGGKVRVRLATPGELMRGQQAAAATLASPPPPMPRRKAEELCRPLDLNELAARMRASGLL